MTKNRPKQTNLSDMVDPDQTIRPVFVLADRHNGLIGPWHSHRRAQLVHVSEGILTVSTRRARFIVPAQRAVWIAPGVEHRIMSRKPFWLTTCYLEPDLFTIPDTSLVVAIDRLTDELLIAAAQYGGDYPESGHEARLIAVLLDRLPVLAATDICLPEPSDARLQRMTERLQDDPAAEMRLADLAATFGLTERTAARLLLKETGLTFGQWRQQMRLQSAFEKLGEGASVTQAAFDVGYLDVSSFIAAFKARFGMTPAKALRR